MSESKLERFFTPRSVAVIGASTDKAKVGYSIVKNLIDGRYKGKIYPVNLKAKKILGLRAYPAISEIPGAVDLAVIVIPAPFVNGALRECGQKGIKNVIVISAGFKETGKEGAKLEEEMVKIADEFGMAVIGPNCLGLADSFSRLNASFANGMTRKGSLGFISQSGAICAAMLDWANSNDVGFSRFVSIGNKAVVSETELLEFFKNDDKTTAVLAYLENIKDGKRFMRAAAELAKVKPLVIIKPGTSKEAQKAMQSHTGALAGADATVEVAFRQAGAVRVRNMEELFNVVKFFSRFDRLKKNRIAIVTNAGGPGVIATDELERAGLQLAKLSRETTEVLGKNLPSEANVHNPVDVLGDAKEDRFQIALEALAQDRNVDGIVFILTPQKGTPIDGTGKLLLAESKKITKPMVVSFVGGELVEKEMVKLRKSPLAVYDHLSSAIFALGKAWEGERYRDQAKAYLGCADETGGDVSAVMKDNPDFMAAMEILSQWGIDTVRSELASTPEEAVSIAHSIGYPVVMKVFSRKISHKTEVEGVKVGIKSDLEVTQYFDKIKERIGSDLEGMILQPMVSGKEVILGVKKEGNFGHLLMFGLGGIYTEIMKDVSFRFAPIDKDEALEMMRETKAFALFEGFRGAPKLDADAVAEALVGLSRLVTAHPEIKELDINPLMVLEAGKGCQAVDVRITV